MRYPSANMLNGTPEKDYINEAEKKETKTTKACLEKIPPQELRSIADETNRRIQLVFKDRNNYCIAYCTECLEKYDKKSLIKTPCIANVLTFDCLCAEHFRQKLERDLCQKYLEENKPKLDLQDFARV